MDDEEQFNAAEAGSGPATNQAVSLSELNLDHIDENLFVPTLLDPHLDTAHEFVCARAFQSLQYFFDVCFFYLPCSMQAQSASTAEPHPSNHRGTKAKLEHVFQIGIPNTRKNMCSEKGRVLGNKKKSPLPGMSQTFEYTYTQRNTHKHTYKNPTHSFCNSEVNNTQHTHMGTKQQTESMTDKEIGRQRDGQTD